MNRTVIRFLWAGEAWAMPSCAEWGVVALGSAQ